MPTQPPENTPGRGQSRRPDDRRPDETDLQWAAFLAYRDLGLGRTVEATARQLGYPPDADGKHANSWIARVASRRRWRERARAYDEYIQKRIDRAKERAVDKFHAKFAGEIERHRYQVIEETLRDAVRLREKARAILDIPIIEIEIVADDSGVTHIHKPMKGATPLAAAQMIKEAAALSVAAITAATKPEYSRAELMSIADATVSRQAIDDELASMDEEEDRDRMIEIEDMRVIDGDDADPDDADDDEPDRTD